MSGNDMSAVGILPPHSDDLEQAVIGAVMLENETIHDVIETLHFENFYRQDNQTIWKAIIDLHSEGKQFDIISVTERLDKMGELEALGGPYAISVMTNGIGSGAAASEHAAIIRQYAMLNDLNRNLTGVIRECYDKNTNPFELIHSIRNMLDNTSSLVFKGKEMGTAALFKELTEHTERAQKNYANNIITGVPTGLTALDKITNGWQETDLIIIAARPGMGKGLPENEVVATPSGFKKMKDLRVGDRLCTTYGQSSNLTGIFPQGERPVYEITFDDGFKITADDQHLWKVKDRAIRSAGRDETRALSTLQLIKEGLWLKGNRKNFTIEMPEPVFHTITDVPLDPYLLGLLIGDGSFSDGRIRFSNPEKDILLSMKRLAGGFFRKGGDGLNHKIKDGFIYKGIKELGLWEKRSPNKFIPKEYLFNSMSCRLKLLWGLLDTDGYVVKMTDREFSNQIEYSTTSERLKDDIMTLVRGLGGRCRYTERMGKYKKDGEYIETRTNYRIWITFGNGIIPVHSEKHLARYTTKKQFHHRFITDIKPVGKEKTICITVDSDDHCFLTKGYLVTHNTAFTKKVILGATERLRKPVAMFSVEMSRKQLMARIASEDADMSAQDILAGRAGGYYEKMHSQTIPKFFGENQEELLFIDDTSALHIDEARNRALRMNREIDPCLFIFDYIQIMRGSSDNREREIGEISGGLKQIAKETGKPVIALSQLNRLVETRGGDKRPKLSDLRESGAIEQDADLVGFLYRPVYYGYNEVEINGMPHPSENVAEFIIAKHRNGGLDNIPMKFIPHLTKFEDWDDGEGFTSGESRKDHD